MSGGKGGSQTQTSETVVPEYLSGAAQDYLVKANALADRGYTPYVGPDVAALSPLQMAAMQNTASAANAFGLASPVDYLAAMPEVQEFANGLLGYSSAPIFKQSQAASPRKPLENYTPRLAPISNAPAASRSRTYDGNEAYLAGQSAGQAYIDFINSIGR